MERALKERLVGAAVLMAAAVILIPEMLSGPRRAPAPQPVVKVDESAAKEEGNRKRYTIDMQRTQPPAEVLPTPTVIEEPAPPPEEIIEIEPRAEAAAAAAPTPTETSAANPPAQLAATAEPTPQAAPEPAVPTPAAVQAPQVTEPASAPPVAGPKPARRWAVRLIAYSSDKREQAQRMAEDLRNGDLKAFVLPVQTPNGTVYSVRIGPFTERADAEAVLRNNKVKGVFTSPEIVVQP